MMKNNFSRGKFITLEGIEGVGKSTYLKYIKQYLESKNIPLLVTREPGGTPIAEAIRHVLLSHHAEPMTQMTELLLMFACRAQHVANVIKPALAKGEWVICDRFTDASYAYQGAGRGLPIERIKALENWVQGDLHPDCILLFDAPVEIALQRTQRRKQKDRIEQEENDFFQRVRDGYLVRSQEFPERYQVINAAVSLSEVQADLKQLLDELLLQTAHQQS